MSTVSLNPCSTGITFLTSKLLSELCLMVHRLNPCSTGITFLTDRTTPRTPLTPTRLNPCSTGITFLTVGVYTLNLQHYGN